MNLPLLVLRPQPGADETAERGRALGLHVIVAPLFDVQPMDWAPPDPRAFDALLLTSASGIRAAGDDLARFVHLPVVAVGEATARVARAAGLNVVQVGDGDGASVVARCGFDRLLHLTGHRHVPFDSARVTSVTVYAAEAMPPPTLPPEAVVLLHSSRAARQFCAVATSRSRYALIAISAAVAAEAGFGWRSVAVADRPTDVAMLAIAASLCEGFAHGV